MDSVPSWAETGRFRYARWDGGILDVVKGVLPGWPSWREPAQLLAVAEWYERRNVELLELAQVNWIWVTFSNGFSLWSELPHQVRLRDFISECQRHDVHVITYMSIANVFYEDVFAREPRSKEWIAVNNVGQPIPYGSANYTGLASNTRYLACLQHPEWGAYLKQGIGRAVEAGCEGIVWDNAVIERCYCPRCEANFASWRGRAGAPNDSMAWTTYYREMISALVPDLHSFAQELKPNLLMYVNANRGLYSLNRTGNAVSSEDGTELGLDADGTVVRNIGLLRYRWAIGEGWRPVRMEYGGRLRTGPLESRFTIPMTPRSHQLVESSSGF